MLAHKTIYPVLETKKNGAFRLRFIESFQRLHTIT